jgi:hypothetical protein
MKSIAFLRFYKNDRSVVLRNLTPGEYFVMREDADNNDNVIYEVLSVSEQGDAVVAAPVAVYHSAKTSFSGYDRVHQVSTRWLH